MNENYTSRFFKSFILIAVAIAATIELNAQCANNLIVNGSFVSAEGEAVTAGGWLPTSTPDVNDAEGTLHCTVGYNWTGTPVVSADGGTWQNVFFQETIEQTVPIIDGESYTIDFEYSAQGISAGEGNTYDQPTGVNIFLNNVLLVSTPNDETQFTWEKFTHTFIASGTSAAIRFEVSVLGYVGIDGVCIHEALETGLQGYGSASSATIFPNPVSSSATIRTAENLQNATLSIFDAMGTELKSIPNISGHEIKLQRDNLPGGIYFLRIVQDDRIISTRRIIIAD